MDVDASVVHPLQVSASFTPEDVTAAVVRQEALKIQHSQELCNRAGVRLALAVVATTGGWGPESTAFLRLQTERVEIGADKWVAQADSALSCDHWGPGARTRHSIQERWWMARFLAHGKAEPRMFRHPGSPSSVYSALWGRVSVAVAKAVGRQLSREATKNGRCLGPAEKGGNFGCEFVSGGPERRLGGRESFGGGARPGRRWRRRG